MRKKLKHYWHGANFRKIDDCRDCKVCDHCECHSVHGTQCPRPCPYPDEHHTFVPKPPKK